MITGQSDSLQAISTYIKAQRELFKNKKQAAHDKFKARGYSKYHEYANELNRIAGALRALKELSKFVQWQLKGAQYNNWLNEFLEPETNLTDFERYMNNDTEIETL